MAKRRILLDLQQLTKLLAKTTSLHDGESLAAVRAANNLLAENNKTWDDVIQSVNVVHTSEDGIVWTENNFALIPHGGEHNLQNFHNHRNQKLFGATSPGPSFLSDLLGI